MIECQGLLALIVGLFILGFINTFILLIVSFRPKENCEGKTYVREPFTIEEDYE